MGAPVQQQCDRAGGGAETALHPVGVSSSPPSATSNVRPRPDYAQPMTSAEEVKVAPRPRARPAIADVAALAGVSAQTVSRVSTGAENVKPETRRRVQAAMDELGYLPNSAARALRFGMFHTIGVVANQFVRTGVAHLVQAVAVAARDQGFRVSLFDVAEDSGLASLPLNTREVDGLIVMRAGTSIGEWSAVPRRPPVVIADSRFSDRYASVGCDDEGGSSQAVRHLLELGHRTVHHLRGPADTVQATQRHRAWEHVLREAGCHVPPVFQGDWTPESGYRQGQLIALDDSITSVFCANDEMAAGLYRALAEVGRRVPDDISVVGFDDVLAEYLWPPLTSVSQDFETIGAELVRVLLGLVRGELDSRTRVLVPARLVVRKSTAPPRLPVSRRARRKSPRSRPTRPTSVTGD